MADNGMPFPSAKANCYEYGIHVPLAICWGGGLKYKGISNELVSGVDIFPTILDAANIGYKKELAGNSILPYLKKQKETTGRTAIFAGRERHSSARYNNWGYPTRVLRTENYLYIRNFNPERWPAGDPCFINKEGSLTPMHSAYFDIDHGPAWSFIVDNRDNAEIFPYFLKAVAKRPYEELYDVRSDTGCLNNLVGNGKYVTELDYLRQKMNDTLKKTGDSRYMNCLEHEQDIWETYPRLNGVIRSYPKPLF